MQAGTTGEVAAAVPGTLGARVRPAGDDGALVGRARRGDPDACRALVERHWDGAWRAALAVTGRRTLAEDVVQDAFERAFAKLGQFDGRRSFAPWLHRIVVNRALDVLRRERRLADFEVVEGTHAAGGEGYADDQPALDALASLTPERRVVVVLRHVLGYTPPEIADITGLPVGTVNSRLSRALADLRAALEDEGG